jgi:hypothetical protein
MAGSTVTRGASSLRLLFGLSAESTNLDLYQAKSLTKALLGILLHWLDYYYLLEMNILIRSPPPLSGEDCLASSTNP